MLFVSGMQCFYVQCFALCAIRYFWLFSHVVYWNCSHKRRLQTKRRTKMLSLELWTKNSQGERTYQGTYRRTWKTMRGLENFRQKVMDYNGYTLEDFKIKGEESRKDNTKAVGTLKVGDVLHSVYGYDMILNSYYEVVKVSPSGKTVQIRPLRKNYDGSPNDIAGCTVYPDVTSENRFAGKPDSHRVLVDNDGEPYVKISTYEYAHPMDMKEAVYGSTEDHND